MAITRTNSNETLNTQSIESYSFDQKYKLAARMMVGEDSTNNVSIRLSLDPDGNLYTVPVEKDPLDVTKLNGSLVLTYDPSDHVTKIEKTIGGTTYTKTLSWTGDNLTGISTWT